MSTTVTFSTSGSWVCPIGVTSATISATGGGGGPGGEGDGGGGGGGGGGNSVGVATVTPGASYSVVVGAGGSTNSDGGDSTFPGNGGNIVGKGGFGGLGDGAGGSGGAAAEGTGTTKFSGGTGGNGNSPTNGGGGGGSASTTAAGTAGSSNGAAGTGQGAGGAGGTGLVASGNGVAPGGGAGGAAGGGTGTAAAGRVVIIYQPVPVIAVISDDVTDLLNDADSGTFDATFTAERRYSAVNEAKLMDDYVVSVVAALRDGDFSTRGDTENEYQIDVAIQKKLEDPEDLEELDAAMLMPEQILNYLMGDAAGVSRRRLTCGASLIKFSNNPIYSPEHLKNLQVFTSVLHLTYATEESFR